MRAKALWALTTLLDAAGAAEPLRYPSPELPASEAAWRYIERSEPAAPRPGENGLLDFGDGAHDLVMSAFWHLSRWEERTGSRRDRHGRFAAASALADPERPAVDAIVSHLLEQLRLPRRDGFRLVLTHDIDTPIRWSGTRAVRAAAARAKAAARARRGMEAAVELRGLAAAPLHRLRRSDPNWTFERIHAIEARHGARSTYFVMAGHHHHLDGMAPATYDRVRAGLVRQLVDQGDDVGLHPTYTASDDHHRLAEERDRLAQLSDRPLRSVRFHFLRHDAHRDLPELERLGFRLDSSQGYADRPGLRAGLSHCYRPYDLARDRPLDMLELPLAVMDTTLQDRRYLGLDATAGARRAIDLLERVAQAGGTVAVLWHNDRFAPGYARGWDLAYNRILAWARDRGGTLCACDELLG